MAKRSMASSYNKTKSDAETFELTREERLRCAVKGCPLIGTISESARPDSETRYFCSYHIKFPDYKHRNLITNVINKCLPMLRVSREKLYQSHFEVMEKVKKAVEGA